MPAYWWECKACGEKTKLSMARFVWDELRPSSWDQHILVKQCLHCGAEKAMRITYEFPRDRKELLTLVQAVGLSSPDDDYMPMMWETIPHSEPNVRLFDFKYVVGRKGYGLNRPAVFTRERLAELFALYCIKVSGESSFP